MASLDVGVTGAIDNVAQRHTNDATSQAARDEAVGLLLARNNMPGKHDLSAKDQETMKNMGLSSAEQLLGPAANLKPGLDVIGVPGQKGMMVSEGKPDEHGRPVSIVYDSTDPKHLSTTYVDSQGYAQSFVTGEGGKGVIVTGRDGKPHNYGDGSHIDVDPKTGCPQVGSDGIPVIKTDDGREIKVNADGTSESKDNAGTVTTADSTGHVKSLKFANGAYSDISPEASRAFTPIEGHPGHFSYNGHEITSQMAPDFKGGLKFHDEQNRLVEVNQAGAVAITKPGENTPSEYWSTDHKHSLSYRQSEDGGAYQWYAHQEGSSEYVQVSAPSDENGVICAPRGYNTTYIIGGEGRPAPGNGWNNGWVTRQAR
jgi:hypothetical protein